MELPEADSNTRSAIVSLHYVRQSFVDPSLSGLETKLSSGSLRKFGHNSRSAALRVLESASGNSMPLHMFTLGAIIRVDHRLKVGLQDLESPGQY